MTGEHEQRYTLPTSAIRTLGALVRTLRHHIADLERLDCEDLEAAEAIVFAMEAAEKAIHNARAVKRGLFDAARDGGPPSAENCD
ncbi:MAG: hypothetical protein ACE5KM_19240 [Planctomycetaceae bacterium]